MVVGTVGLAWIGLALGFIVQLDNTYWILQDTDQRRQHTKQKHPKKWQPHKIH
jgi:hypothetical protein